MSYLRNAPGKRETPQSQPLEGQIPNRAGGHAFEISPEARLRRWLILGSEGGTYYASEREMTLENVGALKDCDPFQAIGIIIKISHEGLAPKNDPAIFALAYYAGHSDVQVRRLALDSLPMVCRTATHLFHFAAYVEKHRGWGRSLRRAVGRWYVDQGIDSVAYQMVKYRQRDGYTHKDLLRLAHPAWKVSAGNPTVMNEGDAANYAALLDWACGRKPVKQHLPQIVRGFRRVQKPGRKPARVAELIVEYNLPWEAIPDEYKDSREVWATLWQNMPLGALIRNLPTMTRVGLFEPMSLLTNETARRLADPGALKKARIHPLNLLVAQLTYASGHSLRGSGTWSPARELVDALDKAFYASFGYLEPTGKRHLLAIDVSGSMADRYRSQINGVPGLTARVAAGVMAMAQAAVGDPYHVVAFSAKTKNTQRGWSGMASTDLLNPYEPGDWAIKPMAISPRMRLEDVARTMQDTQAGGTDCSLPMLYALEEGIEVDAFQIFTDNESWAGSIHPSQALRKYREKTGIDSRLVAVAFTATSYSIADPNDPRMLDCVGLDSSTPKIVQDFISGSF